MLLEDELLASPKKKVKEFDENCDLVSITSKPTCSVKRKLCSEDEIPDIIPSTPTAKTKKFSLSCRHTKHSKMEKCSNKERKRRFPFIDSLNKYYSTDATEDRVLSVNNPELLNTFPCQKIKSNGAESVHAPESKASNDTVVKVVGQVCTEKCDSNNTGTIKNYASDCMNTQDCTKFDNILERVKNHDEVTNQDFEHHNFCSTEQNVDDGSSAGSDEGASSFEQLVDTNDNMSLGTCDGIRNNIVSPVPETTTVISSGDTDIPEMFLENAILHNPVASKNNVSDCTVPQGDIKQPEGTICTCGIPEISKCETKQCTDRIDDSFRSNKTASSNILELNYDCGCVGSSNKVSGYDILSSKDKTEESEVEGTYTVQSKENVSKESIFKSDTVTPEAEGSEHSDQHADVLCGRLQTATVKQLRTSPSASSSDDTAWLSLDNWDFSMIDEKGTR
jgi:hypothetical protein